MIASSISCSLTCFAPASTMRIASFVPETVRCILDFSLSSSVGLMIYLPSTIATRQEPVGPWKGMSEMLSAIDEPSIAIGSGATSGSTESAVAITVTSLKNPFGKRGRRGLSIRRDVKIALSLGLPSRFLNPPGIFPTEYIFSSKSTLSGKKSMPGRGSLLIVTLTITTVSPQRTTQEPFACSANFPVSTITFLPPISVSKIVACLLLIKISFFFS